MGQRAMLVVEDSVALKLLRRADYRAAFPEIASIDSGSAGCCNKAAKAAEKFNRVKQVIASMAPERAAALKQLLAAGSLRVVYQDGNLQVRTAVL